ncbi:MAG TPA: hypothetical protein ENG83_02105 [Nitrospirae bacterium]|nr:hypothetical protein BMS3Bbin15_00989 [archaeon BMS3Bbin15]HDH10995.1 hypothetical protein [Nitrospirota bacterium]
MTKRLVIFIFLICILPALIYAAVTDYLILEDIGTYKLFTGITGRVFSGPPSKYSQTATGGILDAAGHFSENDQSYEASYTTIGSKWPFIKVEVTQHAGSDSDKWLLHEVEKSFRTYYGIPGDPYAMRVIDGNTIIVYGSAGWAYRWVSGNKVIQISYYDSQMEKPEPLEVVSAYLAKHPSTLTPITSADLRTDTNKTKWIKDEMDRRLWLCDKWFYQLQLQKAELNKVLRESVDSMNVFLDYREKYYGISATDEKKLLGEYLQANDGTAIKNKLAEYKAWWSENKDKAISL